MAANDITQLPKGVIVIADTTDYAGDLGTKSDQIDLTSLGAGAARQSAKVDLNSDITPTTSLATRYSVTVAIEMDVAPTSGDLVDVWVGFSNSATAGTANPGGLSGSDAAYSGTAGDSLDDSLKQLTFIGSLVATVEIATTVQFQTVGWFVAPERYASFVIDNNTGQAFEGDAVEMGIRIIPFVDEVA